MPVIDAYAAAGAFHDNQELDRSGAAPVMAVEELPHIPMFGRNTLAVVYGLPADAISNVEGASNHVRALTNAGARDRDKQIAPVSQLTPLVASAPAAPPPAEWICVLLTEAVDGGWGLWGHVHTSAELVQAGRTQLPQSVQTSTAVER